LLSHLRKAQSVNKILKKSTINPISWRFGLLVVITIFKVLINNLI
jgi:hypothetical protein